MIVIAAGAIITTMYAMQTPSCSYRCMEQQRWFLRWKEPPNELPHFVICEADGDVPGPTCEEIDGAILKPVNRMLMVVHPPVGRKPGFVTAHRDQWISPGAQFYGAGRQPRFIDEDDWLAEQDLRGN